MGGRDLERRRTDRIDPYKKLEKRIRLVLSLSQEDFMSLLPSKYRCGMKEGSEGLETRKQRRSSIRPSLLNLNAERPSPWDL